VDDGSHFINHQVDTFKALFPFLDIGGWYIIEDIREDNVKNIIKEVPNCQIICTKPTGDNTIAIIRKQI
jgi:hypothetical protein